MTKDEEVKIGDVVKMQNGLFAGKTGVVVGIMKPSRCDIGDLYYEVEMDCEVPDEYKCRKALLTPNNIIGGVSASEFKVCGNHTPEKQTEGIKLDLSDTYWEKYRANLVRDLALDWEILNTDFADRIVDFATRIVENLKKQSND